MRGPGMLRSLQRHRVRHQGKTLSGITTLSAEQRALFQDLQVAPPGIQAM